MEQNEFLKIIKTYRRRLNMAEFLRILLFALCVGAGAGIVLQAAAFITPIYYVNLYASIGGGCRRVCETDKYGAGGACDGPFWFCGADCDCL